MQSIYGRRIGARWPQKTLAAWKTTTSHTCHAPIATTTRTHLATLPSTSRSQRRSYSDQRLDLPALDEKWRRQWASKGAGMGDKKGGKYVLPMFPYPSGTLHLGHLRVYTIADVIARFYALQGHDVLLPMGWDAFGLPAENAAIERGINPATWTKVNIAKMKEQLDVMNGSWDWSRELTTCDPEFYAHTQKLFLMLHERGLAYQADSEVNWDPVDMTVLANEQVDANGASWRSGAKVEKRQLKQWFFRISEFQESLLNDLEALSKDDVWPERVLAMQRNWLGKSEGVVVKFPVLAMGHDAHAAIEVFTTRPDTLFGVQYVALASNHPVVSKIAAADPELQAFLDTLPGLPGDSKVGYQLPQLRAINPMAYHEDAPEATTASLPIYIASYVVGDYGEGAVMGVPGHDVRDHAFWKEHRDDEPVRYVLAASEDESTTTMRNEPFVDHGLMTEHSGPFKGKSSVETGKMLVSMLEGAHLARRVEKWRLRDWLISRQRYWGTPIPIVHCDSCGPVPVPDDQLPVKLPDVADHWANGQPGNPLERTPEWVNTSCPKCGGAAKRDTDTMDTFVDSSWYYARFADPHNTAQPFSREATQSLPVNLYIGGIEHAILHLLYARFIYKFMATTDLFPESAGSEDGSIHEPFKRLITQGMVHGKTYSDPATGKFLKPDEVDSSNSSSPKVAATGSPAVVSFEKMSKSKHNGVDPTDFIARYGADATRAHMLFQAPVNDVLNWDEDKISGVTRWLNRLYEHVKSVAAEAEETGAKAEAEQHNTNADTNTDADANANAVAAYFRSGSTRLDSMMPAELAAWDASATVWRAVQSTIESVTASYETVYSVNTVVSDLMSLTNVLEDESSGGRASPIVRREATSVLVRMLAPVTPAFAEECWSVLHGSGLGPVFDGIKTVKFPVKDEGEDDVMALLQPRKQSLAVQINGKLRGVVEIPKPPKQVEGDAEKLREWTAREVLETEEGRAKFTSGPWDVRKPRRVILARGGKVINFVV